MRTSCRLLTLLGAAGWLGAAAFATLPELPEELPGTYALHVMKAVTMDDGDKVVNDAVLLVSDGRITRLGPADAVEVPEGTPVYTFADHWLLPGLVEAHNHSAAGGWNDLNDMVYQTNPGLDTRSVPRADNPWIESARTGGVTTVMMIPGSGTNLSGFGTICSTAGSTPDELIMRSPGSLKIAQAGNPEWYFGGNGRAFMNWNARQTMQKARAYDQAWRDYETGDRPEPPRFDPMWDGFRPLFTHETPVTAHTQAYQVLMKTLDMYVEEFGLWVVLDHCTFDAWKLGGLVAGRPQVFTINGPRQYQFDRSTRRMIGNASGWWKNGVRKLGINTDAPVVPQNELSYQAAMACWYGWLPYPALRGITSVPAKSLRVEDRVGSLEAGKQADLTIWTGDPLDPRSACLLTIVRGRVAYDAGRDVRRF
jgi:imidazolonepropionase-like amidohydrolase